LKIAVTYVSYVVLHALALGKITRAMVATELNRIERESGAVSANRFRATVSSFFN
jgi:hypothetical protein